MWGMGPQPTRHPTALRPNSAHPWFCRWSFTGVQPRPWFLSCFLLSLSPATKAESRSCDKTGDLKRRGELTLWLFKKKFEVPAIKGSVSILPQNHRQLLKVMPFGTVRDYFGGLQNHCRVVLTIFYYPIPISMTFRYQKYLECLISLLTYSISITKS